MINQATLTLLLIISSNIFSFAQKDYEIYLRSVSGIPEPNTKQKSTESVLNGKFILQFNQQLSQATKLKLKKDGITFFNYVPNYAWIVDLKQVKLESLRQSGLRFYEPYSAKHKTDILQINDSNRYSVDVFDSLLFVAYAAKNSIKYKKDYNLFDVVLSASQFYKLINQPFIYFVSLHEGEPQPETAVDSRATNDDVISQRSNYIGYNAEENLFFNGDGIGISNRERGRISLGDTINYRGRGTFFDINEANNGHKTQTAWRVASAGILDPSKTGSAPAATFYSDDKDMITVPGNQIQSMAYGTGCPNGYKSTTRTYDTQIYNDGFWMYSYSAGNDGTKKCSDEFGQKWGNISGNRKMGKNLVTVGAVNLGDGIYGFSSRGPALDGRIKPEVVTFGDGGTSYATPSFAGFWGQLQHAYTHYHGTAARSDLLKVISLNTADDIGNEGPDYIHGWGRINARRAHNAVKNSNYFTGTIQNADTETHSLNIPANTKLVKVMVYWHDPAAAANATKHLINDIDLLVKYGGTTYEPYQLIPSSNLNSPAGIGPDHLNNAEQVVIKNPATGNYTIEIKGFDIAVGPQRYTISYEIIKEEVEITHPLGGNSFEPGSTVEVLWDATTKAAATISYSLNGTNWNTITTTNGNSNKFSWQLPQGLTKNKVFLKINNGLTEDVLLEPFYILSKPQNLNLKSRCANEINLSWNNVPNASKYVVYRLGNKFFEVFDTVSTPAINIQIASNTLEYFAVASLTDKNIVSVRTNAFKVDKGVSSCDAVVADFFTKDVLVNIGDTLQFYDLSINGANNWVWEFPGGVADDLFAKNPKVTFGQSGIYWVRLTASNGSSSNTVTKWQYITVTPTTNYGFEFDGVNEHFKIEQEINPKDFNEFTMEAWIRPGSNNNGARGIFGSNHTSEQYAGFILDVVDNTKIKFGYGPGSNGFTKTTGNILATNTWQHVALIFSKSAGKIRFYLDGVLFNSITVTDNAWSKPQIYIGRSDANGGYFQGQMDDFRMWSRALNRNELGLNYCETLPNQTNLIFASNSNNFNRGRMNDTITLKTAQAVNMELTDWKEINNENCEVQRVFDCANIEDGLAIIDNCGICSGGTTGLVSNTSCVNECLNEIRVYASSFSSPHSPEKTLDHDLDMRWSTNGIDEWIMYKFPCPRIVQNLQLAFRNGESRTATFRVETSTDSISWNIVGTYTTSGSTLDFEDYAINSNKINYLRIVNLGNSTDTWISITKTNFDFTLEQDCAGDLGGFAFIDSCDNCANGLTGVDAVTDKDLCLITSASNIVMNNFIIYPTVLTAGETIFIPNYAGDAVVTSTQGKIVFTGQINEKLSTHAWSPGIYFVRLTTNSGAKIIIQ